MTTLPFLGSGLSLREPRNDSGARAQASSETTQENVSERRRQNAICSRISPMSAIVSRPEAGEASAQARM